MLANTSSIRGAIGQKHQQICTTLALQAVFRRAPKMVDKHADNILFVFREGYYDAAADGSVFEVIVAKSNRGRCGTAVLCP